MKGLPDAGQQRDIQPMVQKHIHFDNIVPDAETLLLSDSTPVQSADDTVAAEEAAAALTEKLTSVALVTPHTSRSSNDAWLLHASRHHALPPANTPKAPKFVLRRMDANGEGK